MKVLRGCDLEWLFEELAHIVRQERPLPTALQELAEANRNTTRGVIARRLATALEEGRTLSQAVAREEAAFPPGVAGALQAGERSGRLSEVLGSLSESARVETALRPYDLSFSRYELLRLLAFSGSGALPISRLK